MFEPPAKGRIRKKRKKIKGGICAPRTQHGRVPNRSLIGMSLLQAGLQEAWGLVVIHLALKSVPLLNLT